MYRHSHDRAGLFLIELIIAIFFFSLGSAVCVQAFARAHTTSREARDLAFASSTVSSAANVVKYTDGTLESFQTWFPQAEAAGAGFAAGYDSGFDPCPAAQASYTLRVTLGQDVRGGVAVTTAALWMEGQGGEELYRLDLHWPAGEVAA